MKNLNCGFIPGPRFWHRNPNATTEGSCPARFPCLVLFSSKNRSLHPPENSHETQTFNLLLICLPYLQKRKKRPFKEEEFSTQKFLRPETDNNPNPQSNSSHLIPIHTKNIESFHLFFIPSPTLTPFLLKMVSNPSIIKRSTRFKSNQNKHKSYKSK